MRLVGNRLEDLDRALGDVIDALLHCQLRDAASPTWEAPAIGGQTAIANQKV